MTADELGRVRADFTAATSAFNEASQELADASESRDADRVAEARQRVQETHAALAQAREAFLAVQSNVRPSFEALLANPVFQFDRRGEIMASINAYQHAVTATASANLLADFTHIEPGSGIWPVKAASHSPRRPSAQH
jgi:hypothetical protein